MMEISGRDVADVRSAFPPSIPQDIDQPLNCFSRSDVQFLFERGFVDYLRHQREEIILLGSVEGIAEVASPVDDLELGFSQ
jgi:hypothetical protein